MAEAPKSVIVCVDEFEIPNSTVEYGLSLAQHSGRHLDLMAVQGMPDLAHGNYAAPSFASGELTNHSSEIEEKAKILFEDVRARYDKTNLELVPGIKSNAILLRLNEMVEKNPVLSRNLLLMTKENSDSWWAQLVGTSETTVAAKSPCPVLLIPEQATFNGIGRVLYLADLESVKDHEYPGFRFLYTFANSFGAQMDVALITSEQGLEEEELDFANIKTELLQHLPLRFDQTFHLLPDDSPERVIDLAQTSGIDIIAFPYRTSNFFSRILEEKLTHSLILRSNIPVLVF